MFKTLSEKNFNNKKVQVTLITGETMDFDFIFNQLYPDFFAFGWNDTDQVFFLNKAQIGAIAFIPKD